jgi:hypothetical protein
MTTNTSHLPVTPERAFEALEDPRSFRYLVAGARRVRRFDPRWPEPGTALHHTVGIPPLLVWDQTEVMASEPPGRLLLEARIGPFGALSVEICFRARPDGCEMVVTERPVRGLVNQPVLRQIVEAGIRVRNAEFGRRMRRLVDLRDQAAHGGELA